MEQELKGRVEQLRKELTYHSERYYVYDAPEISDYDYDMMFAELKKLEEEHPELYDPASPTQRVGGKALDKFSKVTHSARMDSLADVFSFEEVEEFADRMRELVPSPTYSVEPKIDGLSVSLISEKWMPSCMLFAALTTRTSFMLRAALTRSATLRPSIWS